MQPRTPRRAPRRATARLATPLLALLLAAPALAAAPVNPDVAWLAETLGVPSQDLPRAIGIERFRVEGSEVTTWADAMPIEEVAALARASADQPRGEAPDFLGAGVRDVTGDGVGWYGFAYGDGTMPCMTFDATATGVDVPAGVNAGGPLQAQVSMHLPQDGFLFGAGNAHMDVALLPSPGADPVTVPAMGADATVFVGEGFTTCRVVFALILTFGGFEGDGDIQG